MAIKRRNHGRALMNRGHVHPVRCDHCGCSVAKDKALSRYVARPIIEQAAQRDIKKASAYQNYLIPKTYLKLNYCVSCGVHGRIVSVRSHEGRKVREPPARVVRKQVA